MYEEDIYDIFRVEISKDSIDTARMSTKKMPNVRADSILPIVYVYSLCCIGFIWDLLWIPQRTEHHPGVSEFPSEHFPTYLSALLFCRTVPETNGEIY